MDAFSTPSKAICIVGAGTAGLAALKALVDLPLNVRSGWEIISYEKQNSLGGIWVPDRVVDPSRIPLTPLYPQLITNTPVPMMTFPDFPFPPGTPLYSSHEHVREYLMLFASHFDLVRYVLPNHNVLSATWIGTAQSGQWSVTYEHRGQVNKRMFDHLIVAVGVNHIPFIPTWPGQDEWLAGNTHRRIIHAVWFRDASQFVGQRVLVIGAAASGIDIANMISLAAQKTYIYMRSEPVWVYGPLSWRVERKTDISHFDATGVVFKDGTKAEVDTIVLGTGYEKRVPFLETSNLLVTDPVATLGEDDHLFTNGRYIFPLYKHMFSLASAYPTNALAFLGLNTALTGNAMLDMSQGIYIAAAIAQNDFLAPREHLLEELAADEQKVRERGFDPYILGHVLLDDVADDYQDELVQAALPNLGRKFVEPWRRKILSFRRLKSAWKTVERLKTETEWLDGVESEDSWFKLMERLDSQCVDADLP